ncbi:O-antigen ligase family protein [Bacteroides zhangwenhongii]|jgi:hypothetical protein|uniref:O-antigen ligase family protein n=1 Tax=Bacteroides zhangwenhongii TaxID=2650157 RepID=UPI0022E093EB|nr:O-antigen ligase family protein [Bacteroides zhangwenhongii]
MSKYLLFLTHLPVFSEVNAPKSCSYLAWLFALVAVSTVSGFLFFPTSMLYFATCMLCLLYILKEGRILWNGKFILLYVAFGISALMASTPLFNSQMRFGLFVMITLVCSPCIQSDIAVKFRTLACRNLLILFGIMSIASFFCYFLGINFMPLHISRADLVNVVDGQAGTFSGLFVHSMLMGPLAALTSLLFFHVYLYNKKLIYIILFLIGALATFLSASRGAVMSLVLPIVYSLLFSNKARGKVAWLLIVSAILAIPVADRVTTGLIEKQQGNLSAGSTFSSRQSKWDNRWDEFNSSPLLGVGFGAVDPKYTNDYNANGGIEPGSSHLSVLSMTGLLGFIPYLLIILSAYNVVRRNKRDVVAGFRLSMLLSCMLYAIVEGHALFAGGFLFLMFWISIAQCSDYVYLLKRRC